MIRVTIAPESLELMEFCGLAESEVQTAVNDRHRGFIDPAFSRIVAVHWLSKDRIAFADTLVADREFDSDKKRLHFRSVDVRIALLLHPQLPAGEISRSMNMESILKVVAESFGWPLSGDPGSPADYLYTGPWRGDFLINTPTPEQVICVCACVRPSENACGLAWAFDPRRYREFITAWRSRHN